MVLQGIIGFLMGKSKDMIIIGSLMGKAKDLVVDYIIGLLVVVWNLDEGLEKLRTRLLILQSMREDAEERQRVHEALRKWLSELKEVVHEADNLHDDVDYEKLRKSAEDVKVHTSNPVTSLLNIGKKYWQEILFRLNSGRKLNAISNKIEEIKSQGEQYGFKDDSKPTVGMASETSEGRNSKKDGESRITCPFVKTSDVVGRQTEKEHMVDMLVGCLGNNTNVSVLAIVGMGGLGKTTLAQLIYNDPRVVNHFQLRGWCCVSDDWDTQKIIVDIMTSILKKKCELPTVELKRGLQKELEGKRYLIVLDDVWNEEREEWKALKDVADCGAKGSAILVTSRNEGVSKIMRTVPNYNLTHLSEDDSWTLFSSRAFDRDAERPEELCKIGKDIANKCGQLPLALAMIGSLLYRENDKREWINIRDSSIWNLQTEIFPALWLSYKHLPPYSKRCFTFCTVFPKDHVMYKDALIQMWMAHGLIASSSNSTSLEDKGRDIFNQLVQRSFLHHIEEKESDYYGVVTTCRMHDLVHDLGKYIVGNECMALTEKEQEETPEVASQKDVYHLSISSVEDKKWKTSSKILRSLLIWNVQDAEIPPHTSLRVLQLQCSTKHLSSLKHLQHLRYLDLSHSRDIKELPESICTLLHLQTLDLSWCYNLLKLPKQMGCMISLRHLYLEGCNDLKEMPRGMGRLTNLQTLTKYVVSDEVQGKGDIGELKVLPLCSFKFEIHNMRHVKDAAQAIEANLHSKDIHNLELYYSSSRSSVTQGEVMNEEDGSDQVLDALRPPGSIKVLRIFNYAGLKSFKPTWMVELQQLVRLELYDCCICHRLPPLWRLKSLEKLYLRHMKSLKYIIFDDDDVAVAPTALPAFPKLKILELSHLVSLEAWREMRNFSTHMTHNCFPALQKLELFSCHKLTSLPEGLTVVKMRMEHCKKLTSLPEGLTSLLELKIEDCEDLTSLPEGLNALRELEIKDCNKLTSLSEGLTVLLKLRIETCEELTSLPEGLTALQELKVYRCEKLAWLPESLLQRLPTLRRLEIVRCPELEKKCAEGSGECGHRMSNIPRTSNWLWPSFYDN